jgi:hypothetical protein
MEQPAADGLEPVPETSAGHERPPASPAGEKLPDPPSEKKPPLDR